MPSVTTETKGRMNLGEANPGPQCHSLQYSISILPEASVGLVLSLSPEAPEGYSLLPCTG